MKEKELLQNEKSSLRKPDLLPVETLLERKSPFFFKGFRTRKRAILKVDDKYIVPVKNRGLTGNKTAGAVKQKKVYNFLSL